MNLRRSFFWVLHGLLRLLSSPCSWSRTQISSGSSRTRSCGSRWDVKFRRKSARTIFPLLLSWTIGFVWESSQRSACSNPGCTLRFPVSLNHERSGGASFLELSVASFTKQNIFFLCLCVALSQTCWPFHYATQIKSSCDFHVPSKCRLWTVSYI